MRMLITMLLAAVLAGCATPGRRSSPYTVQAEEARDPREADRLNVLVSDFLGFARPAAPQPAAVDLPALLGEVMHVFAADPRLGGVQLESEIAKEG